MLNIVSTSGDTLSLDLVKEHLIVDHIEDDPIIEAYISASLSAVENYLHKKVRLVSYIKTLKNLDSTLFWDSPKPLSGLTLTYNGTAEFSIDEYDYNYDKDGDTNYYIYEGNSTITVYMNSIPDDWDGNAFTVTYDTGNNSINDVVTQARLLLIGTWYEQRASVTARATKLFEIPHTVEFLLSPYQDSPL